MPVLENPHKTLNIKAKWVTLFLSLLPQFERGRPIWHLPARKVTAISSLRK
jgi:hypothetical protein